MKYFSEIATTIACMGGFLFGYDLGVISGVLVMPSFVKTFNLTLNDAANLKGDVVALLQVGCCLGALLINFIADSLGRKKAIFLSSIVFIIGGLIQVFSAGSFQSLMTGRFFAGVGIGAGSMLVPMYIAEIAPKNLRGRLGTLWQLLIVLGICISYWVDYGCLRGFPESDIQWQLALGLQIVPGVILAVGILFMPESLRWLAANDRHEQARRALSRLRNRKESDHLVTLEMEEIQAAVDAERDSFGGKFREILQPINLKRLFIGIMVQTFQQWTGTNAINYYAPTIFQSIGIQDTETDVLATGVYGVVKVAFVCVSFFMIDSKLGRRNTLMLGSLVMCVAFYVLGGMTKLIADENGGAIEGTVTVGPFGYVSIVMVYLFAVGFEFSWGPIAWIVCSEMFPTNIRAICLSLTTAFNWANNAIIGKVTPIMLVNLGWGTYFIFGSFAVVMGLFVYLFLPETRGVALEEIDEIFSDDIFVFYSKPDEPYPTSVRTEYSSEYTRNVRM